METETFIIWVETPSGTVTEEVEVSQDEFQEDVLEEMAYNLLMSNAQYGYERKSVFETFD